MPIEPLPDRTPHSAADESGRDHDLMQRIRAGDARALDDLLGAYWRPAASSRVC